MATTHRIHLGSGHYHWPGFENLDEETDLMNLPHEDESVDEIYAIHLFEHLPRLEVHKYLSEWRRVLKPDKLLVLELPSLDKIAKLVVSGERNLRLTVLGLMGDPRDWAERPLMRHEWAWTYAELVEILELSGFLPEQRRPVFHVEQRDMRVIARKL